MSDIKKYLNEQLQNDDFKQEWEKLQPDLNIIDTLIEQQIRYDVKN